MYEYRIKEIIKVYDGDTITVLIDCGFGVFRKESLRLYGINAPEVRGEEREVGLISRDWLYDRLISAFNKGQQITVKTQKDKKGKYGRYLAKVFVHEVTEDELTGGIDIVEVNINHQLVSEGYAEYKEY